MAIGDDIIISFRLCCHMLDGSARILTACGFSQCCFELPIPSLKSLYLGKKCTVFFIIKNHTTLLHHDLHPLAEDVLIDGFCLRLRDVPTTIHARRWPSAASGRQAGGLPAGIRHGAVSE